MSVSHKYQTATTSVGVTYITWSIFDKALNSTFEYLEILVRCVDGELEQKAKSRIGRPGHIDDAESSQRPVRVGCHFVGRAVHHDSVEQINILHGPSWTSRAWRVDRWLTDVDSITDVVGPSDQNHQNAFKDLGACATDHKGKAQNEAADRGE